MNSCNKNHGVPKLNNEISRLSSENDQLRKMVGLIQENVELRYVLRDHETQVKSFSLPQPAEQHITEKSRTPHVEPHVTPKVRTPPVEPHVTAKVHTPTAEQSQTYLRIAGSLMAEASSSSDDKRSLHEPVYNKRSLHMEGLGITGHSDKHRNKQVSIKEYESSGSSSDSLPDPHTKEQRKFASNFTKLHGHERGSKESSRSLPAERRQAYYK